MNERELIYREYNMDRDWRFHRGDPEGDGTAGYAAAVARVTKAGNAAGPASKQIYDDSAWERVDLPHDYMREAGFAPDAVQSQGYRPKENGWYRKTFTVDGNEGDQALLVFEGIATSAEIYFNGSLLRRSFSCYTEIAADVSDRIYYDRINTLAVYVRGDATEGWWYEGAGIYRHVHLYIKPALHIAHNGVFAKPVLNENDGGEEVWTVPVEVTAENTGYEAARAAVRVSLWDGDRQMAAAVSAPAVCGPDGKTVFSPSFDVRSPERWDVDAPKLYTLKTELLFNGEEPADAQTVRIGFRTFRADPDHGFFLNGRPLKIKGVCCHQDHAGVGIAVPDSVQYYRIRRLKEMGCNAYRCAHHPHARAILDACDEYGLIVMDENRNFETGEDVLRNWEITLRRDRNHPSVIFYSLFNEEALQSTPEGRRIYRRLKSLTRRLDDSRLVTGAVNDRLVPWGTGAEMDVFGANYGLGRLESVHGDFPHIPIIGSENNSAVTTRGCYRTDHEAHVLSNYDEEIVPWGCTVRKDWAFVRDHEFFGGVFVWTGFDYRGEPTPFDWPSAGSQFGIMDLCGFPKDAYYFMQAVYTDAPMMHLLPHWNYHAGDTVRVMTVTNCDEAELFLNGRSLGRRPSDPCVQCEWQVPFEAGTLSAVGYRNGLRAAYAERRTAGEAVRVKLTPDRDYLYGCGGDTVPVRVSVTDRDGNELPDADHLIRFEFIGDGFCAGVGNGDPNSHEPEHLPLRHLYCGLCQVMAAAWAGAKSLRLIARSEGLESAVLDFEIREKEIPAWLPYAVNSRLSGVWVSVSDNPEKPDPLGGPDKNDMNSFAPAEIAPGKYTEGFRTGWREYRVPFTVPAAGAALTPVVCFKALLCAELEVWENGVRITAAGDQYKSMLSVPLPAGEGDRELCVLLRARENVTGTSGISGGIELFYR